MSGLPTIRHRVGTPGIVGRVRGCPIWSGSRLAVADWMRSPRSWPSGLWEVEAEREELGIAERVLLRLAGQDRADTEGRRGGGSGESAGGGACGVADPAPW